MRKAGKSSKSGAMPGLTARDKPKRRAAVTLDDIIHGKFASPRRPMYFSDSSEDEFDRLKKESEVRLISRKTREELRKLYNWDSSFEESPVAAHARPSNAKPKTRTKTNRKASVLQFSQRTENHRNTLNDVCPIIELDPTSSSDSAFEIEYPELRTMSPPKNLSLIHCESESNQTSNGSSLPVALGNRNRTCVDRTKDDLSSLKQQSTSKCSGESGKENIPEFCSAKQTSNKVNGSLQLHNHIMKDDSPSKPMQPNLTLGTSQTQPASQTPNSKTITINPRRKLFDEDIINVTSDKNEKDTINTNQIHQLHQVHITEPATDEQEMPAANHNSCVHDMLHNSWQGIDNPVQLDLSLPLMDSLKSISFSSTKSVRHDSPIPSDMSDLIIEPEACQRSEFVTQVECDHVKLQSFEIQPSRITLRKSPKVEQEEPHEISLEKPVTILPEHDQNHDSFTSQNKCDPSHTSSFGFQSHKFTSINYSNIEPEDSLSFQGERDQSGKDSFELQPPPKITIRNTGNVKSKKSQNNDYLSPEDECNQSDTHSLKQQLPRKTLRKSPNIEPEESYNDDFLTSLHEVSQLNSFEVPETPERFVKEVLRIQDGHNNYDTSAAEPVNLRSPLNSSCSIQPRASTPLRNIARKTCVETLDKSQFNFESDKSQHEVSQNIVPVETEESGSLLFNDAVNQSNSHDHIPESTNKDVSRDKGIKYFDESATEPVELQHPFGNISNNQIHTRTHLKNLSRKTDMEPLYIDKNKSQCDVSLSLQGEARSVASELGSLHSDCNGESPNTTGYSEHANTSEPNSVSSVQDEVSHIENSSLNQSNQSNLSNIDLSKTTDSSGHASTSEPNSVSSIQKEVSHIENSLLEQSELLVNSDIDLSINKVINTYSDNECLGHTNPKVIGEYQNTSVGFTGTPAEMQSLSISLANSFTNSSLENELINTSQNPLEPIPAPNTSSLNSTINSSVADDEVIDTGPDPSERIIVPNSPANPTLAILKPTPPQNKASSPRTTIPATSNHSLHPHTTLIQNHSSICEESLLNSTMDDSLRTTMTRRITGGKWRRSVAKWKREKELPSSTTNRKTMVTLAHLPRKSMYHMPQAHPGKLKNVQGGTILVHHLSSSIVDVKPVVRGSRSIRFCPNLDVHFETLTISDDEDDRTAEQIVLDRCGQMEPMSFQDAYPESRLPQLRKIGEGVFGEVFMYRTSAKHSVVLKIIPIEGDLLVNGEPQKKFEEMLPEIIIADELSKLRNGRTFSTSGFVRLLRVRCVRGVYPEHLLDQWDLYRDNRGTENDSPEDFDPEQLFIVLEQENAGIDLEAFKFRNAGQALSALQQITLSLAVAEQKLEFEHRDLHWGNILLAPTDQTEVSFSLKGRSISVPTSGVKATIIDYTLSRMVYNNQVLHNDLSKDEELFSAEGDYQFDIYRLMQERLDNRWMRFNPYTNVLWLHYVVDKMIAGVRYVSTRSRVHLQGIEKLRAIKDVFLDHQSALAIANDVLDEM